MKRIVLTILTICLVALLAPALASAMTYDEAVDQLVADGYTRDAEDYLVQPRHRPVLGFRLAGTWAEHDASYFVRDELTAMGLSDVRLEAVPVDAWDFKGATVTVGGRDLHRLVVRGRAAAPPARSRQRSSTSATARRPSSTPPATSTGKIVLIDSVARELVAQHGRAPRRRCAARSASS